MYLYIADIAIQLGYEITFLDDSIPEAPLPSFISFISDNTCFIPAFGDNAFRLGWINRIQQVGGQLATLIYPTAYISPTAIIKSGTVVLPKAVVNTGVVVEKGCILNCGCIVDHGCVVEEGSHICLGAIVKAENRVERLTKVEAREVIEARIRSIQTE